MGDIALCVCMVLFTHSSIYSFLKNNLKYTMTALLKAIRQSFTSIVFEQETLVAIGPKAAKQSMVTKCIRPQMSHILDAANDGNTNVLHFSPFNDNIVFCGDSNGALTVFDISDLESKKSETIKSSESVSAIHSLCSHVSSNDIVAIGANNCIPLIDLRKWTNTQ